MKRRKEPRPKPTPAKPLSAHEAGKFSPRVRETAAPAGGKLCGPTTPEFRLALLTTGEAEVLALMAQRLSNTDIAQRREVELSTIHKHIENIYPKLGVQTRADAISLYLQVEHEQMQRERESLRRQNGRLERENAARRCEIERLTHQVESLGEQLKVLRRQIRAGV